MKHSAEVDENAWHRIEELLKLREDLKRDHSSENPDQHAAKIEEVEFMAYEALGPKVCALLRSRLRGRAAEALIQEIAHDTIFRLLNGFAGFRGEARLKTYVIRIARNLATDRLRKINQEKKALLCDEERLTHAANTRALQMFNDQARAERRPYRFAERNGDLFELMDFKKQNLTKNEFVAVVLKFASAQMKEKITDKELASMLGLNRTAFLQAYMRGRDKIYRHLAGRPSKPIPPDPL